MIWERKKARGSINYMFLGGIMICEIELVD